MTSRGIAVGIIAASILFVSSLAHANDDTPEWAKTLKNLGKVYSGDENSVVQEVKFFGRAHG